jgi:hypothetical protein
MFGGIPVSPRENRPFAVEILGWVGPAIGIHSFSDGIHRPTVGIGPE